MPWVPDSWPGWGPCHSQCSSLPVCLSGAAAGVGEDPLSWRARPAPGVRLPRAVCACWGHLGGDGKCGLHTLSLWPLSWASLLGSVAFCRPFIPFCAALISPWNSKGEEGLKHCPCTTQKLPSSTQTEVDTWVLAVTPGSKPWLVLTGWVGLSSCLSPPGADPSCLTLLSARMGTCPVERLW